MSIKSLVLVFALLLLLAVVEGQVSKPFASNKDHKERSAKNKFVTRDIASIESFLFGQDHSIFQAHSKCPVNMHLRWQTELDGSVYSTPVIGDVNSDGVKDIISPTFLRHVEILEGKFGHEVAGFPFTFPNSVFHSSPILYDINGDGFVEIGLVSFNAEIVWLFESGTPVFGRSIKIPGLSVTKNWYAGLDMEHSNSYDLYNNDNHAQSSNTIRGEGADDDAHFDESQMEDANAGDEQPKEEEKDEEEEEQPVPLEGEEEKKQQQQESGGEVEKKKEEGDSAAAAAPPPAPAAAAPAPAPTAAPTPAPPVSAAEAARAAAAAAAAAGAKKKVSKEKKSAAAAAPSPARKLLQVANADPSATTNKNKEDEDHEGDDDEEDVEMNHHKPLHGSHEGTWAAVKGWLTDEGADSLLSLLAPTASSGMFGDRRLAREMMLKDKVLASMLELTDEVPPEEAPTQSKRGDAKNSNNGTNAAEEDNHDKVTVDPHVFATPVIADIDRDGHDEIVVPVSYFFAREHYNDPSSFQGMDLDIDISKYVAGGIVVYDLQTGERKWSIHLDLTTDDTKFRAYIYSAPTVADIDGDGFMEVIVGTSVGFIYVIEHDGVVKAGFPVQMAEIQGQVVAADVNNDGILELIAADTSHNVAVWSPAGAVIWERHISGFSAHGAVVGDLNGDGELDIVLATTNGHVWALRGSDGSPLKHFPMRLGGRVLSPVSLLHLNHQQRPLHIAVPAHDGKLYLIYGSTGCAFKVDIAEQSYSMVLADDVTGNGKLDLVVTTMNGHVMVFGTDADFHPTRVWTSREQGRSNLQAQSTGPRLVAFASDATRTHRDISGAMWKLEFDIVDQRSKQLQRGPYKIKASIGGRIVLLEKEYSEPGHKIETVPAPRRRQYATVMLELTNSALQSTFDSFSISFNMHFYRLLKWILVVPFLAMFGIVFFVRDMKNTLPI